MTTDERRARAIEDTTNDETQEGLQYVLIRGFSAMGYGRPISAAEDILREAARAIRASDEAAGMVLVPRYPTLEMLQNGREAGRSVRASGVSGMTIDAQIRAETIREAAIYRAMIAATEADHG